MSLRPRAGIVSGVIAGLLLTSCSSVQDPLPGPSVPATTESVPEVTLTPKPYDPATDPELQAWFKLSEPALLELNDAIAVTGRELATRSGPGTRTPACSRLAAKVRTYRSHFPPPLPELSPILDSGLPAYVKASASCQTGDLAAAKIAFTQAATERADYQDRVDEVLFQEKESE